MRPLTERIPKSLIPVDDQPFVHHQLRQLAERGITDAIFCVGYKGQMIREFVGDGARWGLRTSYVDEGEELMGTAGALRKALDEGRLPDEFLVLYGDSYLPIDHSEVWRAFRAQSAPALMTVLRNDERWDRSNACFDGRRVTLYDKWIAPKPPEMRYVDYGLSAMRRFVIETRVPKGEKMDLARVFHALSLDGELAGYEVDSRFYEIGSPQGLKDLQDYLHPPRKGAPRP